MCTSIVSNRGKTIVWFNLDIIGMEYKVVPESDKVTINVYDSTEGCWMPLFGANSKGDFVAMPTCWPYDNRSDPAGGDEKNIILLNIDLLLGKKSYAETRETAENVRICSVPGLTFQSQLSDANGNVLQIVPGQGVQYFEKPDYAIMTNFSPYKGNSAEHPLMGWDRYLTAKEFFETHEGNVTVDDMFSLLRMTAQEVCPTVVSMVFDAEAKTVYWCENRQWDKIQCRVIG